MLGTNSRLTRTCAHTCTPGEASSGHCLRDGGPGTSALLNTKAVLLSGLSLGVPFTSQSPSAWGEGGPGDPSAGFALCASFDNVRMVTQL